MKKKSDVYFIRCLAYLIVMAFLAGFSAAMDTQSTHMSQLKENSVNLSYETEKEPMGIPPVDAAAPKNFETASFGLG